MNPQPNTLQDCMAEYIENVSYLAKRVQQMQQRQREALAELLLIKAKCQALRRTLTS